MKKKKKKENNKLNVEVPKCPMKSRQMHQALQKSEAWSPRKSEAQAQIKKQKKDSVLFGTGDPKM